MSSVGYEIGDRTLGEGCVKQPEDWQNQGAQGK